MSWQLTAKVGTEKGAEKIRARTRSLRPSRWIEVFMNLEGVPHTLRSWAHLCTPRRLCRWRHGRRQQVRLRYRRVAVSWVLMCSSLWDALKKESRSTGPCSSAGRRTCGTATRAFRAVVLAMRDGPRPCAAKCTEKQIVDGHMVIPPERTSERTSERILERIDFDPVLQIQEQIVCSSREDQTTKARASHGGANGGRVHRRMNNQIVDVSFLQLQESPSASTCVQRNENNDGHGTAHGHSAHFFRSGLTRPRDEHERRSVPQKTQAKTHMHPSLCM